MATPDPASEFSTAASLGVLTNAWLIISINAGLFNVLWVTVTILMIVRPGSTTGT